MAITQVMSAKAGHLIVFTWLIVAALAISSVSFAAVRAGTVAFAAVFPGGRTVALPGGLGMAIPAALRGHQVQPFERRGELGGKLTEVRRAGSSSASAHRCWRCPGYSRH